MSELILKALMQLFALISDIHDDTVITGREKDVVRMFLMRHLNNELVTRYMKMFEEYLGIFNSERIVKGSIQDRKRTSLNATRILAICEQINEELKEKQKIYVFIKLIDYIASGDEITENELDFLRTVANAFYVSEPEYRSIKSFIMNTVEEITEKKRVLIIDSIHKKDDNELKHLYRENLNGSISFLHISVTNTYIMRYSGNMDLYLNGQNISTGETYIFDNGSSIRGSGINTIHFTEVVSIISDASSESRISLDAYDVTFKFNNSDNGIHNLNFHEETGRFVGILGGSGVGKSTTLSILNGTLKPQRGEVLINGYNLYEQSEKEYLKGVIGFVPQDDLLIEDLTVYQNLYYNAKMCLNNHSESEIVDIVKKTLADLDLGETGNLKVGNPLKKIISGGQRKRVNIALELLREPTILFVDEPTSGLSSVDSEIVMNLLKEQTYKGKLVIVNIHQPSSDFYKMFDKIMIIDKGGYQIYYGDPVEAIVYFKTHSNHANPFEDQCIKCGNIDTDQILQIIESKINDERGKATRIRKISPEEWAKKFQENSPVVKLNPKTDKQKLPENYYSIPGLFRQSKIFFIRDYLSKLADRQYILISLFGSPLLALLLSYFTSYSEGTSYKFSANENIPAYLFMCVITSLFFGLMISSEEIVKDRKILKRESFLDLSWFSYLNAKILILFLLSAIQTLSFILIGNLILQIRGMTLSYWLVLFTTSCFANMLGLNISSALNSVITIYIIIPFILIPQLLFSGVLVKFDKLHSGSKPVHEYVPFIGDLMTARWSFEALAVDQFKNNKFEKPFYNYDRDVSQNNWYASYLAYNLKVDLRICMNYKDNNQYRDEIRNNFRKLNLYIDQMTSLAGFNYPADLRSSMNEEKFDYKVYKEANTLLDSLSHHFLFKMKNARAKKDSLTRAIETKIGNSGLVELKNRYENERLKKIVLAEEDMVKILETPDRIIQRFEPVFMKPSSKYGRAHFYAPVKMIGNLEYETYWFNISVIWIASIMLYMILYFNLLRKLLLYFENLHLQKSETKM
jgi:ABC transport system ATP-binding/permease protein